jgi:hypothetical protein
VLGLAGFMYHSSGLLPWQEPGRPISRTEGSYPRQCQFPVFCCFCVTEKLHRKYSQNWMKPKPVAQNFTEASREPKRRRSGATRAPHTREARPRPWPCPLCVRPPRSTSDDAPSPIKTPRREKPKDPITFTEHIAIRRRHRPEDREGLEALPGTLPERGIATGGLLHHHACLRSDE